MDDQQQQQTAISAATDGSAGPATDRPEPPPPPLAALNGVKKAGARRNPWGNMSYADLITQAISTAPEQRLTLAQIYEWLVKNVPYFHGKGDNISSIGWKVGKPDMFNNNLMPRCSSISLTMNFCEKLVGLENKLL